MSVMDQWTPDHRRAAHSEGWDIFSTEGQSDGDWQIQRCDNPQDWEDCPLTEPLDGDEAAWALVKQADNPTRRLALEIIEQLNPAEHGRIMG